MSEGHQSAPREVQAQPASPEARAVARNLLKSPKSPQWDRMPELDEAARGRARRFYEAWKNTIAAENAARDEGRQWEGLPNLPEEGLSEEAANVWKRLKQTSLYRDKDSQWSELPELDETEKRRARRLYVGLQEISKKSPLPPPLPENDKIFEKITAQRYQATNELFEKIGEEFGGSNQRKA